jgi:anti-anti-sigma regulatory factor
MLQKRISTHGGVMRVSGLSPSNQQVLRICRLDRQIPHYANREQAVWGQRPQQPR